MADMFFSGKTYLEISVQFGVSRQRVQQILRRIHVDRSCGGIALKNRVEKEVKAKIRAESYLLRYGCSEEEFRKISSKDKIAFSRHKYNSKRRGIGFELSLIDWCGIWNSSGHVEGRRKGGYVMARTGDVGPYAIGNVRICSSSENVKEYWSLNPMGVQEKKPAIKRPAKKGFHKYKNANGDDVFSVRFLGKRWGTYKSEDDARFRYTELYAAHLQGVLQKREDMK